MLIQFLSILVIVNCLQKLRAFCSVWFAGKWSTRALHTHTNATFCHFMNWSAIVRPKDTRGATVFKFAATSKCNECAASEWPTKLKSPSESFCRVCCVPWLKHIKYEWLGVRNKSVSQLVCARRGAANWQFDWHANTEYRNVERQ